MKSCVICINKKLWRQYRQKAVICTDATVSSRAQRVRRTSEVEGPRFCLHLPSPSDFQPDAFASFASIAVIGLLRPRLTRPHCSQSQQTRETSAVGAHLTT